MQREYYRLILDILVIEEPLELPLQLMKDGKQDHNKLGTVIRLGIHRSGCLIVRRHGSPFLPSIYLACVANIHVCNTFRKPQSHQGALGLVRRDLLQY